MARRPIVALLALLCARCLDSPTATENLPLGSPFDLKSGESVLVGDAGLRVAFTSVASDSRCPQGAACVWPGDAVVDGWSEAPKQPRTNYELHTYPLAPLGGPAQVFFAGYQIRLVDLSPRPMLGQTIDPRTYVATLKVTQD